MSSSCDATCEDVMGVYRDSLLSTFDIIETGRRNSAKFQYFFRQEVDLCRRLSERPSQLGSRLLGCYWLLGYNAHCFGNSNSSTTRMRLTLIGSGNIDKNKWTGNPKIDSTSFSVLPIPLDERGGHRVIQPRPVPIWDDQIVCRYSAVQLSNQRLATIRPFLTHLRMRLSC